MASTNQSPFYQRAEQEYLEASSDDERIACLEVMIKECPKHKSSENMLRNLTLRLKKLKDGVERQKKAGKGGKAGIKKDTLQTAIAGFTNSGKTSFFNLLTGQDAKVSPHQFTTFEPNLGTFYHDDVRIQIIDLPSFPNHDKSIANDTDALFLVITDLSQIEKAEEFLYRSKAKIFLIFNVCGQDEREVRKIEANLKSKHKKYPFFTLCVTEPNKKVIEELTRKVYKSFPVMRVYTKEPKKDPSKEPMILKNGSTVGDAAEKILKGMSKKVKRTKIWGPSSKFGGQGVGLSHELKDKDVVEFATS